MITEHLVLARLHNESMTHIISGIPHTHLREVHLTLFNKGNLKHKARKLTMTSYQGDGGLPDQLSHYDRMTPLGDGDSISSISDHSTIYTTIDSLY